MASFKSRLKNLGKKLQTAKKKASEEGFGFGQDIDDGRYKAKIAKAEIVAQQTTDEPMLAFHFEILAGDFKGTTVRKYYKLEDETSLPYMVRDMGRFGIECPEDGDSLQEVVDIINDAQPEVKISAKTNNKDQQFIYLDRVVDEVDFGEAADSAEEDEDDYNEADEDEAEDAEDAEEEDEENDDSDDDDSDENEDGEEDEGEDEDEEDDEEAGESDEEDDEAGDGASDDEETEINVGMKVSFEGKSGKTLTGKIVKLLEDQGKVKVKVGEKTFTVPAEELSLPEEEPEKPTKKKPAASKKPLVKNKTTVTKKKPVAKKRVVKKKTVRRKR